ncbi:hypothetical protein F2P81_016756 [Scophthalmus maximus]|uniref:Uncharacterized protein n=1 Tax=Scophthalmus maximus TaxID=52904 RepID=A0A6A4SC59_SCOMX|nr:hypothetical protein F2P81_016756 [Scophthalmus maximus]
MARRGVQQRGGALPCRAERRDNLPTCLLFSQPIYAALTSCSSDECRRYQPGTSHDHESVQMTEDAVPNGPILRHVNEDPTGLKHPHRHVRRNVQCRASE